MLRLGEECMSKSIKNLLYGITINKVSGDFNCSYNHLTSLEGSPEKIGGSFNCFNNNLTSLEGSPKEIGGDFRCSNNNLTSLEGSPKEIGGDFDCFNNPQLLKTYKSKDGIKKWIGENVEVGRGVDA